MNGKRRLIKNWVVLGFGSFIRSRTHFNIFPKVCNVSVTTLTWPQIKDIITEIHKLHILLLQWRPEERKAPREKKTSSDVIANLFKVEVNKPALVTCLDLPGQLFWNVRIEFLAKFTKYIWTECLAAFGNDTNTWVLREGEGKASPPGTGLRQMVLNIFWFLVPEINAC